MSRPCILKMLLVISNFIKMNHWLIYIYTQFHNTLLHQRSSVGSLWLAGRWLASENCGSIYAQKRIKRISRNHEGSSRAKTLLLYTMEHISSTHTHTHTQSYKHVCRRHRVFFLSLSLSLSLSLAFSKGLLNHHFTYIDLSLSLSLSLPLLDMDGHWWPFIKLRTC
jgi:hypothetical protein